MSTIGLRKDLRSAATSSYSVLSGVISTENDWSPIEIGWHGISLGHKGLLHQQSEVRRNHISPKDTASSGTVVGVPTINANSSMKPLHL